MKFQKLIIIGAPRSGTNMLRNAITSFDGIATWPCDEINYIWRHGNRGYPSDEIPMEKATNFVVDHIKRSFHLISNKYNADVVVEKTCANSLRIPFVDNVLPDAKYIFIYRNGIDAAFSASKAWESKLDIFYILKKIRYIPKTDLPYYIFKYALNKFNNFISKKKNINFWGPIFDGMSDVLNNYKLIEVCALQWKHCLDRAEEALSKIEKARVIKVRYEDFVQKPRQEMIRILNFLGKKPELEILDKITKSIDFKSIGKGRSNLNKYEITKLESLVGDTLKRYGY